MNKLPRPNKDLGQHFLKDQKVIGTICDNFKDSAQAIIEVGPGPAILTKNLSQHNLPFVVIEKDNRFLVHIENYVSQDFIFFADALDFDFSSMISDKLKDKFQNKKIWLVSNLPYNISAPLTIKFLQIPEIHFMTLMYQKEVARKIIPYKKNEMNSLLCLCHNFFECKYLMNVSPGAFLPPPKVDSGVISFIRRESPQVELSQFHKFESFLRLLFSNRRKQILNVLKEKYNAHNIENILKKLNIPATKRAEALTLEDVIHCYKNFHESIL